MKSSTLIFYSGAFIVATLATAFALALTTSSAGDSFSRRIVDNALRYGWAAGITVTALLVLVLRFGGRSTK